MVFVFLGLVPFLITNIVSLLLSHRRPSLPYILFQGIISIAASLILCSCYLIPADRMRLYSFEGFLQLSVGKTTILSVFILSAILGFFFGIFVKENILPAHPATSKLKSIIRLFIVLILLFLTQGYFWGRNVYSNISIDEILFHLNMPLEGTADGFIKSVLHSVLFPTVLAFTPIAVFSLFHTGKKHRIDILNRIYISFFPLHISSRMFPLFLLVWFLLLFSAANTMLGIGSYIRGHFDASTFIEDNYVSPRDVNILFPEKKRNLITVFIESFESTNQDIENGGALSVNLIPEMTQIAKENISFSRNELITGASVAPHCSWTMSGLVAQTAALPLMHIFNQGAAASALIPGAITLGDILKDQGYRLMFMAGSDFTFGGRRAYYGCHGDYEIWDLLCAKNEARIPADYYENWGFEDLKLYEYAKEKLLELAQDERPFHFSLLTADTHTPGYRCSLCPTNYQGRGSDALNYADTLRCTSIQFAEFLSWCKQQSFYDNTTIVITGDHLSMQDFFYYNILGSQDAAKQIDRYVYNAFINSAITPVTETNRLFTTMDFFPTVLASLGVSIEGNRLGLGTNLFSEQITLSEQFGEEFLFSEISKRSIFYDQVLFYASD